MPMFRKKPVVIEARLLTVDNIDDIAQWCGGYADYDGKVMIETLEGVLAASPDDYVIQGVKGEFYPCKPDIFAATYDPIDEVGTVERTTVASGSVGGGALGSQG